MSPQSGLILIEEIIPRLRATVPECVMPVGVEDAEELLQDAIAVAAQMLHTVEHSGREVIRGHCLLRAALPAIGLEEQSVQ